MGAEDSKKVLNVSHLGILFILAVGGATFLGLKADEWLGTSPLWTLLGLAFGFVSGFHYLIVTLFKPTKIAAGTKVRPESAGQPQGEDPPEDNSATAGREALDRPPPP